MVDSAPTPVPPVPAERHGKERPTQRRPGEAQPREAQPGEARPGEEYGRDVDRAVVLDLRPVLAMASQFAGRDATSALGRGELLAGRILKVTEEVGEAAQAYIGMTGRNPRKGVSHSEADLAAELCDVALSAMVALAAVDSDWPATLQTHVIAVAARTRQAFEALSLPPRGGTATTP